jgi:hypothetical protein
MIPKPLDQIEKADILALLRTSQEESTTLEYKSQLPGLSDSENREFRYDVTAFANTQGGDLVYGIVEKKGIPTAITGLKDFNPDGDVLRLLSILRANVNPPLQGIQPKVVEGFEGGPVLVVRIPRSWSGPHMIPREDSVRFYMRHNRGKYAMSPHEIRQSFLGVIEIPERARLWRKERLALIASGETPVPLLAKDRFILHIVPLESFSNLKAASVAKTEEQKEDFTPPSFTSSNSRINADGVFFEPVGATLNSRHGYTQVFRSGRLESVLAGSVVHRQGPTIGGSYIDKWLVTAVERFMCGLATIGVCPPLLVLLSALGVKGAVIVGNHEAGNEIDRDAVLVPDEVCESYNTDVAALMMPIMDVVWNASGLLQSQSDCFTQYRPKE